MTQTAPSGPGVPALLNIYNQAVDAASILTADAEILQRYLAGPQWGIFMSTTAQPAAASAVQSISSALSAAAKALGVSAPSRNGYVPLLVGSYSGNAVADVAFSGDAQVPTYPVEQGAFETYDKIQLPYSAKVTICIGGTIQDRSRALAVIEGLKGSTQLVNVVTPERTYGSATVTHYDYDRAAAEGAAMLKVALWLQEIPVTAIATAGASAQPNGANAVNGGTVQGYTPSASMTAAITQTPLQ